MSFAPRKKENKVIVFVNTIHHILVTKTFDTSKYRFEPLRALLKIIFVFGF